jgi:hypothetical protein
MLVTWQSGHVQTEDEAYAITALSVPNKSNTLLQIAMFEINYTPCSYLVISQIS